MSDAFPMGNPGVGLSMGAWQQHVTRSNATRRFAVVSFVALLSAALASCGLDTQSKSVSDNAPEKSTATSAVATDSGSAGLGTSAQQPRYITEVPKSLTLEVSATFAAGTARRVAASANYNDGTSEDVTAAVAFTESSVASGASGSGNSNDSNLLEINKAGDIRYRRAGTATVVAQLVGLTSQSIELSASHASPTDPDVSFTSNTGTTVNVDSALYCTASGATDPDGTPVNYRFEWSGTSATPTRVVNSNGSVTETYIAKAVDRGGAVGCTVYAEDSAAEPLMSHGMSGAAPFAIRDRAPSSPEATASLAIGTQFKVGGRIRCVATGSIDADGDAITYEIKWRNVTNGLVTHEANGQETYTITESDIGKAMGCDARATSNIVRGAESSSWASSEKTLMLTDLPPVVTDLVFETLIPDPTTRPPNSTIAYPGDVLVCTAYGYDPNGLTARWGLTGDTITRTRIFEIKTTDRGRTMTCAAQLVNSAGLRSNILTKSMTIENRPPEVPTVAIGSSSSSIIPGSTLTCMGRTTDPDDDVPLFQTITWSGITGSVNPAAQNMYTVTSTDTGPITCNVTFCDIYPYASLSACPANSIPGCCSKTSDPGSASLVLGNYNKPNPPVLVSFGVQPKICYTDSSNTVTTPCGTGQVTGIWTSGDGATPPVATQDYLIAMYPSTTTWAPTDGGLYATGDSLSNGGVIGYAGVGVAGTTLGATLGTLGGRFDLPYGRYKYGFYARAVNGRYSNVTTGEVTVGVTIKAIGPTPLLVRAKRDSVYWDLVYDGASAITLTASDVLPYGSPVGITSGTPVVSTINSTTRRVTFNCPSPDPQNLCISGAGTLRFGLKASTAASPSGNARALSSFYVTPVTVEMQNVAPTAPVVTLTHQDGVLTCAATSSDANGDLVVLTRAWKRNGSVLAGKVAETYKIGTVDENTSLTCEVVASDSVLMSSAVTSTPYAVNSFCSSFGNLTAPDTILADPYSVYNATSNPYLICNPAQVTSIADGCGITTGGVATTTMCAKSFKLRRDIDMTGVTWTNKGIGAQDSEASRNVPFSGVIDGSAGEGSVFAIRGLTITRNTNVLGYTSAGTAFINRLTGKLTNIALERLTVSSSTGDAAALVYEAAVAAKSDFSSVRTSAVVTSSTMASAFRRINGATNIGENIDVSGIFTSTGTSATTAAAGVGPDVGNTAASRTDKVTAWITAVGPGAPGLSPGRDSVLIGSGFSQQTTNAADGSQTQLFSGWNPTGDLSRYANPAVAESTRQLAVTRALFYNPATGVPVIKFNQNAVYDSNSPGLASTGCISSDGLTYNNYPLRQVSANVFAGINHPVMHAVENPFGSAGTSTLSICAGSTPYPIYGRSPFTNTEALPASLATAMIKQTYVDRGWDFSNPSTNPTGTWDFDDALPYLRTSTFPVSFVDVKLASAGSSTTLTLKPSVTKQGGTTLDTIKVYARSSASSPRMIPACSSAGGASFGTLVGTWTVNGVAGFQTPASYSLSNSTFPVDLWLCGTKNGSPVIDAMMLQSDVRPEMFQITPVSGSQRLGFTAFVSSSVVNTYDELQVVEALESVSDSVIPASCPLSNNTSGARVVSTLNLASASANSYITMTRNQNSPQILSPGTYVSYLLCGKMKSSYLASNNWANQGASQPTSMTPMFMFKNIQSQSAPVVSNVTASPASPTYLTSTTISGAVNMAGKISLYSDANCSTAFGPGSTNVASSVFQSAGALINVTANATTSIYYMSTTEDGSTQSLCNKVMDFVNSTVVPTVTFATPSASYAKAGESFTVGFTITDADIYNVPAKLALATTGTATGTLAITGSGGNYLATVSGITGNGTIAVRALADAGRTNAGLGNAQTDSATVLADIVAPVITSSALFKFPVATALDTVVTDLNGSLVNTDDPTAVLWEQTTGTPNGISISNIRTFAPTISGTTAGTYGLRLTVKDRAGNVATKDVSVIWNASKPVIDIATTSPAFVNGSTVSWTVTYSNAELVTLRASDVTINGTGVTATKSVLTTDPCQFTSIAVGATVSCTVRLSNISGNGTLGFTIAAGTATSNTGLTANAITSTTLVIDQLAATVVMPLSFIASAQTTVAPTSVTDSGSGIASYAWSLDSAPANGSVVFGSASAQSTTVTAQSTIANQPAPDGNYVLRLRVTDNAGNAVERTTTLVWAATPPTVTVTAGPSAAQAKTGSTLTYTLTFSSNCSSIQSNALLGSTYTSFTAVPASGGPTGTRTVTGSGSTRTVTVGELTGDGTLALNVLSGACSNVASIASTATASPSTSFKVDNTPPTVSISSIGTVGVGSLVTPTVADPDLVANQVTGSGIASYAWSKVSVPTTPSTGDVSFIAASPQTTPPSWTIAGTIDGSYSIQLAATDAAGNTGTVTAPFTWSTAAATVDIGTPSPVGPVSTQSITFDVYYSGANPASINLTAAKVLVTATGTAGASTKTIGGSGSTRTVTLSGITGTGSLKISIVAGTSTNYGATPDVGAGPSNIVVVDNSPPVVTSTSGATVTATAPTSVSATVSEPDTSATYLWTNQTPNIGTLTFASPAALSTSITSYNPGTYTVRLTATNAVGLSSYVDYSFTWSPPAPTVTIFSPTASAVKTNGSVQCDATKTGTSVCYTVTYATTTSTALVRNKISLTGTATGTIDVTGSGSTYNVILSAISGSGTLGIAIASGSADNYGTAAPAATSSTFFVDDTAPAITLPADVTVSSQVTLTATAADAGSGMALTTPVAWTQVSGPGGTISFGTITAGASNTYSVTAVATGASSGARNGLYVLRFTATDKAGNQNTGTMNYTWNETPPTVTISAPALSPEPANVPSPLATRTTDIVYTVNYSGAAQVYLTAANVTVNKANTANAVKTVLPSDPCTASTCTVKLSSITGNGTLGISIAANTSRNSGTVVDVGPASASSTVKADNSGPTISIPAIGAIATAATVTATVSDPDLASAPQVTGTGNITYLWSKVSGSGAVTFGSPTAATTTVSADSDTTYTIQLAATDAVGNTTTATQTFTWAATRPRLLSISGPTPTITNGATGARVSYTVTYDSVASNIDLATAGNIVFNATGSAAATVSQITGTGATRTIELNPGTMGEGTIGITIIAGTSRNVAGVADNAGATSSTFKIDRTAPAAFSITGPVTPTNGTTPTVAWGAATDSSTVTYTLLVANNVSCTTPTQTYNSVSGTTQVLTTLAAGTWFTCVTATDAAGNPTTASNTGRSFVIDTTPPAAFSITGPVTPTNGTTPTVAWGAATDTNTVTYTLKVANNVSCTTPTQTYNSVSGTTQVLTTLAAGTWYTCVTATDAAGNATTASNTGRSFVIDTTPPAAPVISTIGTKFGATVAVNAINPTVVGTAEINSTITVYSNSISIGTAVANGIGAWSFASTLAVGSYAITAKATDVAGSQGAASTAVALTIDTTAPVFAAGGGGASKQAFIYTGSDQSFTVPTGVNSLTVKAWGAGGGGYGTGAYGGGGGFVTTTISVTAGETLAIIVGEGGKSGGNNCGLVGRTYGGGGAGGGLSGYAGYSGYQYRNASGGGRSALRRGSTELATAGGGGGGGYQAGGGAGGTVGTAGVGYSATGAQGATQSAGGAGGASNSYGPAGSSGLAFQGGDASTGITASDLTGDCAGGGGGGFYGGGGGTSWGGGGGGSSYWTGSGSSIAASTYNPGNTSDTDYAAGIGAGGTSAVGLAAANGRVVLSWSSGGSQTINATGPTTITPSVTDNESNMTYQWTDVTSPSFGGTVNFSTSTSLAPSVTATLIGTYTLRVTATNAAGLSATNDYTFIWNPSPPIVYTPIINTGATTMNSLTLNWTAAMDPNNLTPQASLQYLLQYSTSSTAADSARTPANASIASGWSTNITQSLISSLTPGTTYYFWLNVKGQAGNMATSGSVSGATSFNLPATPTNFAATSGSTSIGLSWTAVQYAATYTISRSTSVSGTYTNVVTTASTSYSDATLTTAGTYYYKVIATNVSGSSAAAGPVAAIFDNTAPVFAGSSQSITGSGPTTITPSVTDNESSMTYQWTDVTSPSFGGTVNFSTSTSLAPSVTATAIGTYTLRVRATNAVGLSTTNDYTFVWNPPAPVATISGPFDPTTGLPVTLVKNGASVKYTVSYTGALSTSLTAVTVIPTGLASASYAIAGSGSSYTVTLSGITGSGTLRIRVPAGTATYYGASALAPADSGTFTVDGAVPGISSVSLTSPNAVPWTSGAGVNLDFTVIPSEIVTVTGPPTIPITIGSVSKTASYVSASSTTTSLVFRYTTQAGDNGLVAYASPVTGTITDSANNATVNPTLTGANTSRTIDTAVPTISNIALTAPAGTGTSGASVNLDFTITTSEATTVSGTPTMPFTIGGESKTASYVSGSGPTSLTFRYTTSALTRDNGLVAVASPVTITGSLADATGNSTTSSTFSGVATVSSRTVDTAAPTFTSTSVSPSSGTLTPSVGFTLNEAATVTLYSDSGCSTTVIYASTSLGSGAQSVLTNALTANATTSIYAKGVDAMSNTSCVSIGSYINNTSLDAWAATSLSSAPSARVNHTAVWSGSKMIVWGGLGASAYLSDGGQFDPTANSWSAVTSASAPAGRRYHTAVWSTANSRMIVWGGTNGSSYYNDGGQYDPVMNAWTSILSSITNVPPTRHSHTAVWTGSKMIVWGGRNSIDLNDGGQYDPVLNTWTSILTTIMNTPTARYSHTAVWTGAKMIVWGGTGASNYGNGGVYDPAGSGTWASISSALANSPSARYSHTAVWTGAKMIVWGGTGASNFNDGGQYDLSGNFWTTTTTVAAPAARFRHAAVWTGNKMIVWGGTGAGYPTGGGQYDPTGNSWLTTTMTGVPVGRSDFASVWNGSKMIVWGGLGTSTYLNDGGVYTPPVSPVISVASVTPAIGSTFTPTVTFTLSNKDATVTLYSNSACSVPITSATFKTMGSGLTMVTNALAANTTTTIYAYAVDASANTFGCSLIAGYLHDNIVPAAPVISTIGSKSGATVAVNAANPTIVGTAEVNSTVTVYSNSISIGTAVANGSGAWSFASTLAVGSYTVTAKATDAGGNQGAASTAVSLTIDMSAPTISSVSLTSPSGTGTSVVGVAMDFTVTPSEAVTVSGTPTLPITIAGVSSGKVATYVSGSSTSTSLVFRYTTVANDNGILGWTTPITGTITDLAGNGTVNPVLTAGTTSRTIDAVARVVIGTPSPLGPVSTANLTWPVTYYGIPTGYLTAAKVQINKTGTANASTPVTIGGSGTNFTVTLTGITGTGNLGISILYGTLVDPASVPVLTLATTSYTLAPNQAMTNITPTLTGGALTGCTTSPTLPAGLSINSTTCVISGTPTSTSAATNYTMTATNAAGTSSQVITIEVNYYWQDVTTSGPYLTMKDARTGLKWTKRWADQTSWQNAVNTCSSLTYNGVTGWRLPTQNEHATAYTNGIYGAARANWMIATDISDYFFWSGTTNPNDSTQAWNSNLNSGPTSGSYITKVSPYNMRVVCVQ